MVGEPVEQGTGETLGTEHFGPLVERQVRGHERRAAFVALTENFEPLVSGLFEARFPQSID